ncbi:hypothetical protein L2Z53_11980 (plasmid) [Macrococcoides canis]|uniref:hypothetical protein n=1 Tax=Macrococcoides canis TaxID=1855823 RepID=UPI001F2CB869|nr:hypothetical protein [Macrococcus canis]UJS29054.1 hypothetical protein L2Z53_11980 [Macrococcus canis]
MFEVIKESDTDKDERYCKRKIIKITSYYADYYILVFNSYFEEVSMLFSDSDFVIQIDEEKYMYITDELDLVEEKYHFLQFNLDNYMIIDIDIDHGEIIVFQGIDNIMKYKKIPPGLKVYNDGITSVNINGQLEDLFIFQCSYYYFQGHASIDKTKYTDTIY